MHLRYGEKLYYCLICFIENLTDKGRAPLAGKSADLPGVEISEHWLVSLQ